MLPLQVLMHRGTDDTEGGGGESRWLSERSGVLVRLLLLGRTGVISDRNSRIICQSHKRRLMLHLQVFLVLLNPLTA